ncbi:hypothetical protein SERLA73DRAFT_141785 [Serpula lacrymans var. lacrymans S7.3]|uniref:Uncharacterized protein n=1 Tax=Serpula lacrymans var. lacrymans (strain S7.3) TaxID=936435 RepID=F8Q5C4_SERL3|nr:hypothetical protein SERLA73DRAFT_141785 [Serpula lacrymans var. lacrymans S7.3]
MAKEMQHLREVDIGLREENGHLQEELRKMIATISGLRHESDEAKRTIASIHHAHNERSEREFQTSANYHSLSHLG